MKLKEFIKDYLTFTRKERIGIIVLIIIITAVFFSPVVVPKNRNKKVFSSDTGWASLIQQLEKKDTNAAYANRDMDDYAERYQYDKTANAYLNKSHELFYFDPNTLPAEKWRQLGLRDKTIRTIQNYLSKGGSFKKADDLQKIYGLHKDEYERLQPFIKIEVNTAANNAERKIEATEITFNKKTTSAVIEINTADTTAFISLPGIGSKLAARIVNFRDKLGGFYSIDQIQETYGLPDSTFQKIKSLLRLGNAAIKKININTATKDEMKIHPYIKWNIANAIVEYRNQHGNFQSLGDLKKIAAISEETFNKIVAYLSI